MTYTHYDQLPLVLSVDDLTEILGIGRNTAYELIRYGKIKSVRIGHQIRVPKDSLLDYLKEN
mgnify:CR=1 FL=1